MITSKDIGKSCFVKFNMSHGSRFTWENVGAKIAGISKNRVMIKLPDGEIVAVEMRDVRVFEPRPQVRQ